MRCFRVAPFVPEARLFCSPVARARGKGALRVIVFRGSPVRATERQSPRTGLKGKEGGGAGGRDPRGCPRGYRTIAPGGADTQDSLRLPVKRGLSQSNLLDLRPPAAHLGLAFARRVPVPAALEVRWRFGVVGTGTHHAKIQS